ncbi:hypothetical protein G6F70_003868 [Rhizopus microsporus]|uniref:Uncharacterized protein n=2 Tax=Rhizopus TaxID=4842 RepID=A0A0A1PMF4_RHIZD|nr:hypothetical protein G6F71_003867 [Rhizopus microsporus]KAG1200628.1 hypothetical protein G6F70_003868 [Rhizopus microsporus]KAG1216430.1 hypothetical protein G6F69_000001 [Rhizopus microsporus]KAG1234407.1 hypothetical protein G6F67_003533 [Rhizopus microsporus]KAG1266682.1 hypothetical protein G6F68_002564 [Rhizopus microsporus]
MKLLTVSALSALAACAAALPAANHMDLAKRAYVTNVVVETVTVTEDAYLFAYDGSKTVDIADSLELALSGVLVGGSSPLIENCNDLSCPLSSIIGDMFSDVNSIENQATVLPDGAEFFDLDYIAQLELPETVDASSVSLVSQAPFSSAAYNSIASNSIASNSAASSSVPIPSYLNNPMADFTMIAGHIIDDAQRAIGGVLDGVFY